MSIIKNSPDMNIVNQINAALNDVRATLIELTKLATPADLYDIEMKAHYQLNLAMTMIGDHQQGVSHSWSDLKHQVDEEFS